MELLACFDVQPVEEARQLMTEYRVRRLPVLDQKQRLVGIVSFDDLSGWDLRSQPQRVVFYKTLTASGGQPRNVPLAIVHITDRHAREEVEVAAIKKFERDRGIDSREVLAKGCPLDLHRRVFTGPGRTQARPGVGSLRRPLVRPLSVGLAGGRRARARRPGRRLRLRLPLRPAANETPVGKGCDLVTCICRLYCGSGPRSALAGKTLKDLGYQNVYDLGGFKDWVVARQAFRTLTDPDLASVKPDC